MNIGVQEQANKNQFSDGTSHDWVAWSWEGDSLLLEEPNCH